MSMYAHDYGVVVVESVSAVDWVSSEMIFSVFVGVVDWVNSDMIFSVLRAYRAVSSTL
jgi:hypothetical protein